MSQVSRFVQRPGVFVVDYGRCPAATQIRTTGLDEHVGTADDVISAIGNLRLRQFGPARNIPQLLNGWHEALMEVSIDGV